MGSLLQKLNQKPERDILLFLEILPRKLIDTEQVERLRQLLTNFDFIKAKIETKPQNITRALDIGVQALLEDYARAITANFDTEEEILQSLQTAIRLSANALEKHTAQTYPQIYARLLNDSNSTLHSLLNNYQPNHPWLRMVSPTFKAQISSLIRILEGHTGIIKGCAISNDGTKALSASRDCTLRVWNLKDGLCEQILIGHRSQVNACSLSANAQLALSASDDNTLRLWDVGTGNCLRVLEGHTDKVTSCALSQDGKLAISASYDQAVRVWHIDTGQCVLIFDEHEDRVKCCALSSDGKKALSGSCDRTLRLWDTQKGECLLVIENEIGAFNNCALSGDGRFALTTCEVVVLDIDSDSQEMYMQVFPDESANDSPPIESIDMNTFPDAVKEDLLEMLEHMLETAGSKISDLGEEQLLKLWDLDTGECIRIFEDPNGTVLKCALSEDAQIALSSNTGGSIRVWDVTTGTCLSVLSNSSIFVSSCALDKHGNFALSASQNLDFRLWDIKHAINASSTEPLAAMGRLIAGCRYNRSGNVAVSVSYGGVIQIWDAQIGECLGQLSATDKSMILECSISLRSRVALVASARNLSGELHILDIFTGETVRNLNGHTSSIYTVAISEDGRLGISAASDKTFRIWDISNGRCIYALEARTDEVDEIRSCALSSDGNIALFGSRSGKLQMWNTEELACVWVATEHTDEIADCALSANGLRALSSSRDGTLRIWEAMTGNCLHVVPLVDAEVLHHCTLSTDGKLALYASQRQTIQVIYVDTAELIANFTLDSWVSELAFSPDGSEIMVGDYSGCVHFMKIEGIR